MKVDIIAGARPNFVKIAPIIRALNNLETSRDVSYRLVHTGQHYDREMSGIFFEQLEIPEPDINLAVGSGSQAEQTAEIMKGYEKVLNENSSSVCVVVGDVNSSMACAITARKCGVPVAHVEAGIRSGDWAMPEEINRVVTDSISNWFYTTSKYANENLIHAGIESDRIFFVGNTMIDTLKYSEGRFFAPKICDELGLQPKEYLVMTMHRPSNVDSCSKLQQLLTAITSTSGKMPIIFPVHPRTLQNLGSSLDALDSLHPVQPVSYLEFNYLVKNSLGVITDSGGITEETTVMGVPCITLRDSTERPETVEIGTNELIGTDPERVSDAVSRLVSGSWKTGDVPPMWDGKTSARIVESLIKVV